ncbi:flippase [Candidatus Undinarchaeota archaeon]
MKREKPSEGIVQASYTFTTTLLTMLIGILIGIALARFLGPANYGVFGIILSLSILFRAIADLGVSASATYYISNSLAKKNPRFIRSILSSAWKLRLFSTTLSCLLCISLAKVFSAIFNIDTYLFYVLAVIVLFSSVFNLFQGIFRGFRCLGYTAISQVSGETIKLLVATGLVLFGFGVFGATIGVIAGFMASVLLASLLFMYKIWPKYSSLSKLSECLDSKLLKYGSFFFIYTTAWLFIAKTDVILLSSLRTHHEVGIYVAGVAIASLLMLVPLAIVEILFPSVTMKKAVSDSDAIRNIYFRCMKFAGILNFPAAVLMGTFAAPVIAIALTSQYLETANVLWLLLFMTILHSFAHIASFTLTGIGDSKKLAHVFLFQAGLNFILNLFFIPLYGIYGAAFATLTSYLFTAIILHSILKKSAKVRFPTTLWKAAAASIALFLFVYPFSATSSLLSIILLSFAGMFLYFILLALIGGIDNEDIRIFKELSKMLGPFKGLSLKFIALLEAAKSIFL